jgi:hypothetical protein
MFTAAAMLIFAACNSANDESDQDKKQPTGADDDRIIKVKENGTRVQVTVWCEGAWQDPRITMGYRLSQSNKCFFDRYVMLYGGRLANQDCAADPDRYDGCVKTGFHLHHPARMLKILQEWETYYKPIQDEGIKFVMALVPAGGGVAHGTLYSWPFEDVAPWASLYPANPEYPFGPEQTQKFIDEILEAVDRYHIDGIGFDDEYGNAPGQTGQGMATVYPDAIYYASEQDRLAAWQRGGENMFRFAYELKKQAKEKLNKNLSLEDYEIRYGAYMPEQMEIDGETVFLKDIIDISYEPNYGAWKSRSGEGLAQNHIPRSQFGPVSIDIGSATALSAPQPANTPSGIEALMDQHNEGDYGAIMFFSLVSRNSYLQDYPANYFNPGSDPCVYFSKITQKLFGEDVTYIGDDYKLDW